jgi:hypothetical protein
MKSASSRKPLFWLTVAAWSATLLLALMMARQESQWSLPMKRLKDLGFHHGGTSPVVALQLAGSQEIVNQMMPVQLATGRADRGNAIRLVQWDFPFIVGYASLFVLLALRVRHGRRRWLLISLAVFTGLCDLLENLQLLAAIRSTSEKPDGFHPPLLVSAATLKWTALFLLITLTGYSELTQSTYRRLPAFWRCLSALLMLAGGVTGLLWCGGLNSGLLLQNGLAFVTGSLALFPLRFLLPDGKWCR